MKKAFVSSLIAFDKTNLASQSGKDRIKLNQSLEKLVDNLEHGENWEKVEKIIDDNMAFREALMKQTYGDNVFENDDFKAQVEDIDAIKELMAQLLAVEKEKQLCDQCQSYDMTEMEIDSFQTN
jgi:hypothetical protein